MGNLNLCACLTGLNEDDRAFEYTQPAAATHDFLSQDQALIPKSVVTTTVIVSTFSHSTNYSFVPSSSFKNLANMSTDDSYCRGVESFRS